MDSSSLGTVLYVCRYADMRNNHRDLIVSLAACEKAEYLVDVLKEAGYAVDVISYAWTQSAKVRLPKDVVRYGNAHSVTYLPTTGAYSRLGRLLSAWRSRTVLLLRELLARTKKGDAVFVYHAPTIAWALLTAKKVRDFKLVLEVEEVYHLKERRASLLSKYLEHRLMSAADAYVLSNDMMAKLCSLDGKPYAVAYGNYQIVNRRGPRMDDGKIHVVYAGTIDQMLGAFEVAECGLYLGPRYVLHLIGPGKPSHISALEARICEINGMIGYVGAVYDGVKRGPEYDKFLHQCHIGVSCQNPEDRYTAYSFPSKILSYMARGLRVVCSRVACVVDSAFGDLCSFYDYAGGARALAEAVWSVDLSQPTMCTDRLRELHRDLVADVGMLLGKLGAGSSGTDPGRMHTAQREG